LTCHWCSFGALRKCGRHPALNSPRTRGAEPRRVGALHPRGLLAPWRGIIVVSAKPVNGLKAQRWASWPLRAVTGLLQVWSWAPGLTGWFGEMGQLPPAVPPDFSQKHKICRLDWGPSVGYTCAIRGMRASKAGCTPMARGEGCRFVGTLLGRRPGRRCAR
jgi:hypothetical protein